MINPGTLNTQDRGTYKGYRIERHRRLHINGNRTIFHFQF